MCEVGFILKHGLLVSSSRLGEVSRIMELNHVGKVLEGIDPDVLPLPVDDAPAEEAGILQALRGSATPSHTARDFGRSLRVAGRAVIAEKDRWLSLRAMRGYINQALLDSASADELHSWAALHADYARSLYSLSSPGSGLRGERTYTGGSRFTTRIDSW